MVLKERSPEELRPDMYTYLRYEDGRLVAIYQETDDLEHPRSLVRLLSALLQKHQSPPR